MNPAEPQDLDFDVVSPVGKDSAKSPKNDPFFSLLASLMDDFFHIPGTKIHFGLDPLLSLIPAIGDGSGALVSAFLIIRGAAAGLPRIVLARMALNVLVNTLGGAIPILGNIFTFWFKSNRMNYALFEKYAGQRNPATRQDWIFVVGLIGGLLILVVAIIVGSLTLLTALWRIAWAR